VYAREKGKVKIVPVHHFQS